METKPSQSTRSRLIEAATELLWARSYQATSVDQLCARAAARKGSFYHFFASKTDLAVAAVEHAWERTRAAIFEPIFSGRARGLAQLRVLVERVEAVQRDAQARSGTLPGCPFGNLGQEMAHQDERLRQALQAVFDAHCAYIERALDRAVRDGEIPAGDNRQRARAVFASFEGALLLAKVANDPGLFRTIASSLPMLATGTVPARRVRSTVAVRRRRSLRRGES